MSRNPVPEYGIYGLGDEVREGTRNLLGSSRSIYIQAWLLREWFMGIEEGSEGGRARAWRLIYIVLES